MLGNFYPREREPHPRNAQRLRAKGTKSRVEQLPVRVTRYFWLKRILDIAISSLLAILLMPFVALTAIAISITSFGPAFYTQVRLGRLGKPFVIWKLRTMEHNCENRSGAKWSGRGDRRVTPLGRMLRKLHIDEFPQLWNVLRGEMSLVGPRPERPEFFPILSAEVPNYSGRLLVRPGVTGVAQVYLPPDEDIADVRRKQLYDLYYIRQIGLWLDLRILVATGMQSVGVPHRFVRLMLFLPDQLKIEGRTETTIDRQPSPLTIVENTSPKPLAQTVL